MNTTPLKSSRPFSTQLPQSHSIPKIFRGQNFPRGCGSHRENGLTRLSKISAAFDANVPDQKFVLGPESVQYLNEDRTTGCEQGFLLKMFDFFGKFWDLVKAALGTMALCALPGLFMRGVDASRFIVNSEATRHATVYSRPTGGVDGNGSVRFAALSSATRKGVPVSRVAKYKLQEVLSQKLAGKLFAIMMVALPIIFLGGLGYRLATGAGWTSSLFKAYTVMSDVPGAECCQEENLFALVVSNLIFVSGLFTFAVILGIVCDDISNMVEDVRSGNYQILEEGHTVILNSNKQLGSVIRQMAIAKQERGLGTFHGPVIVLADEDKDEMDEIVERSLDGLKLDVKTRRGCTHDVADLRRVAAERARTVIWLEPEEEDETVVNARRTAAIASMKALGAGLGIPTHMIVQTPECSDTLASGLPAVSLAIRSPPVPAECELEIVEMYDAQNLDRLLAQCALQPGLGRVMSQILEQSMDCPEFYLEECESLEGRRYFEARRFFDQSILCGLQKNGSGHLLLNPSENEVVEKGDKMLLLAESVSRTKPRNAEIAEASKWVHSNGKKDLEVSTIHNIVLCFGDDCEGLLQSMGDFANDNVQVSVICRKKPAGAPKTIGECKFKYYEGNPASYRMLSKFDLREVESVVLAGLDDFPPATADAQVISSIMQIQDLCGGLKRSDPLHVVAPINNPKSKEVANHLISEGLRAGMPCTMDLILPQELSSGVLTQVAAAPGLDLVFKDLLDPENVEIYIRNPAHYSMIGRGPISWTDTMEVVRSNEETAIGYIDKKGILRLAPQATSSHVYEQGDRLVVLARQ